jgi:hypothetical protein
VIEADYFDGESARAHPARLAWGDDGMLVIAYSDVERRVHPNDVQWPERQRHGARIAHLLPRPCRLPPPPGTASLRSAPVARGKAWSCARSRAGAALHLPCCC